MGISTQNRLLGIGAVCISEDPQNPQDPQKTLKDMWKWIVMHTVPGPGLVEIVVLLFLCFSDDHVLGEILGGI